MKKSITFLQMGLEVMTDMAFQSAEEPERTDADRVVDRNRGACALDVAEAVEKHGLVAVLEALRDGADAAGDAHDGREHREEVRELRAFSANIGRAIEAVK